MNRKYFYIFSSLLFITVLAIGLYSTGNITKALSTTRYQGLIDQNIGFKERAKVNGQSNVEQVEILRPDNKGLIDKLQPVEKMKGYIKENDLTNGATYLNKELLDYESFINKYDNFDFNPAISGQRMVWVVTTNYPKGFNHRNGFVKNAVMTSYYDAETGEKYGYSLKSLDKDGYGIKMNN